MEVNLHDSPPFIYLEDNVAVSRTGDVIYCYELFLPEKHSFSEEGYDEFNSIMVRAFKNFERDTCIHRADYISKVPYNASLLPDKTYLQKTFKNHHSKKFRCKHRALVFFTWTLSDIFDRDAFINPFKKLQNEKEILDKLYSSSFPDAVNNAISYVNQTKKLILRGLTGEDIEELCRSYFNGLREGVYTDTESNGKGSEKKTFKTAGRLTDIFTVHSIRQLPRKLTNVIVDKEFSEEGRKFVQGLTEPFGISLPFDHIVNQIIFIPSHKKLLSEIEAKQEEFYSSRGFGLNKGPAENLAKLLTKLRDEKIGTKLVKAHFNVIVFTDSDAQRADAKNKIQALFNEYDIVPYLPSGNAFKGLFINSFFAFSSRIPSRFTFLTELEMACALMIPTTGYKDDAEGIYFNDRIYNSPLRRDIWDANKIRIKARNGGIIAPTGQGKSTLCQHVAYQFLDNNYKLVINDLGRSYFNLYRHYKSRAVMLDFQPGEPTGINPFAIDDPGKLDSLMVNYLCDLINLFHFKGSLSADKIPTGHNTAIRKLISAFYQNTDEFNLNTFYKFFQFIHKEKKYEDIGIDPEMYDAAGTMGEVVFSLSEFNEGVYSYLFQTPKDDRKLFRIQPDTDFAYFEFDKAGEDPLLQSILQQYSFQATREVIWEDKSQRGIMLNDEYAKLLKFPAVAASTEYAAQTIRKYNGAFWWVIQSVMQLPKTDTIGSILDNTSVFHILPTDKSHTETADRLQLPPHQRYLLDSINSNFSGSEPYTEVFQLLGKYANVVRVQLPIEHYYSFQTEGDLYNTVEAAYKKHNDMPMAIEEIKRTLTR